MDEEPFYEAIEGFDQEPWYAHRIRVERHDRYPGQAESPQDTSRYGYRLIEVLERTEAP